MLPINQPRCPFHFGQEDGAQNWMHRDEEVRYKDVELCGCLIVSGSSIVLCHMSAAKRTVWLASCSLQIILHITSEGIE